jgi:hypothetical protein
MELSQRGWHDSYPGIGDVAQQTFFPDTSDNPIEKAARNKTLATERRWSMARRYQR